MTTDTTDTDRIILASDTDDTLVIRGQGRYHLYVKGEEGEIRASVLDLDAADVAAMGRRLLALVGEAAPTADGGDDLPGVPSPYTEGARLMLAAEVPDGWERRWSTSDIFCGFVPDGESFVEARPAAPVMVTVDAADLEAVAEHLDNGHHRGSAAVLRAMIADAKAGQ